jgi:hypothetical protein
VGITSCSDRFRRPQDQFRGFGIGINDAANGVFLPGNLAAEKAAGAAIHATIHTSANYGTVNAMLGAATTRTEVFEALGAIRQALLGGGL